MNAKAATVPSRMNAEAAKFAKKSSWLNQLSLLSAEPQQISEVSSADPRRVLGFFAALAAFAF